MMIQSSEKTHTQTNFPAGTSRERKQGERNDGISFGAGGCACVEGEEEDGGEVVQEEINVQQ